MANFPTSELDAFCFVEEPAELVERLAALDVTVVSRTNVENFVTRLKDLLPGNVSLGNSVQKDNTANRLNIVVGSIDSLPGEAWPYDASSLKLPPDKGIVQMQGDVIALTGGNSTGVAGAMKLLTRFAELARAEQAR